MGAVQENPLRMPYAVEHVALTAANHAKLSNARFDLFVMMEHPIQRRLRSSGNVVAPDGVTKEENQCARFRKDTTKRAIECYICGLFDIGLSEI